MNFYYILKTVFLQKVSRSNNLIFLKGKIRKEIQCFYEEFTLILHNLCKIKKLFKLNILFGFIKYINLIFNIDSIYKPSSQ